MIKLHKSLVLALTWTILSTCGAARQAMAAAAPSPKVVFLGDEFTAQWPNLFTNSNFINKGVAGDTSSNMLARFQSDVVSAHPAIVHILAGSNDIVMADFANTPLLVALFESNMMAMITEARNANIKVILGTIPPEAAPIQGTQLYQAGNATTVLELNAWIESYGLANKIPVINYHDLLCSCVGSIDPGFIGSYSLFQVVPTSVGYADMTSLVETGIATMNLTLNSGYLSAPGSVNQIPQNGTLKFTPIGVYSDGVARALLNTDFAGHNGTWTSSNTNVVYVGQDGTAYALAPGKATVSFVAPNGKPFSPWILTVTNVF